MKSAPWWRCSSGTIDTDRSYPLSPRIGQLRGILAKLEPPKPAPPPPPPKRYEPPRATAKQRRPSVGSGSEGVRLRR